MSQKILVATRNPGKRREISAVLQGIPYDPVFPDDLGLHEEPAEAGIETGSTFEANALRKAEYFHKRSRLPTVAEDSGLEVLALGGRPGVRSRRFALAEENQDEANNAELLRQLAGAPPDRRGARYQCVAAFVPDAATPPHVVQGSCSGRILAAPRGVGGFGYDPLFYSEELGKTFAEATPAEKHAVSHRGRAFRALKAWLASRPF